ncbi:SLAM family member 8-like isoform X1 [Podarcis lilfordi]|uniref:SLAM family member 8-like isoform X1 n=1 Tax=Podarcis lilfordi TaxID=74358 RepID=A0AA35PUH9_9SAUR|nr:SLAM family member 8-like isoform X1 [Podarcis lilfordi]
MDGSPFKFLLFFGIVFLPGTGPTAQNSPPTYVNELQGRSVLLHINIPSGITVDIIKLDFQSWTGEISQLAEINGTVKYTSDRLGQRLTMVNKTTLKISHLQMEDSGLYKAHVRFKEVALYPTNLFYLTVSAPVPKPQITLLNVFKTSEGVNVTLRCLVPGEEKIDISWGRGDPASPLEESSDRHCLSGNDTVLQLFRQSCYTNSTIITCQASNAVDQKNASYDLNRIPECEGADWKILGIILGSIFGIVALGLLICWKRKALTSRFQTVFCHKNSTSNTTELQEVETSPSASQNGYSKCAPSEPDKPVTPPLSPRENS